MPNPTRDRTDRCPGALRPWPAADGLLVRLRLIGGRVSSAALRALADVAERYGDGRVRLTARANLQLRGLPGVPGALRRDVLAAIEATGLLPARAHELVRNVMVSPPTGLAGGRADVWPVADELDRLLCADARLATLSGRFLNVLDDGRGDLMDRSCDLGLVALDNRTVQLRVGAGWGPVVPLRDAAWTIAALATEFVRRRGTGPAAAWHVAELTSPLQPPAPADARLPAACGPPRFGRMPGGEHVGVPDGALDRAAVERLTARASELIVTPWRGVLVPEEAR